MGAEDTSGVADDFAMLPDVAPAAAAAGGAAVVLKLDPHVELPLLPSRVILYWFDSSRNRRCIVCALFCSMSDAR